MARLPFDLATLDAIDWEHLPGAYGPSVGDHDVAAALRTLATDLEDDSDDRQNALDVVLWSHGFHQGTSYPVSVAIVPFVVALVDGGCDPTGELAEGLEYIGCALRTEDAFEAAVKAAIAGHAATILGWRDDHNRVVARLGAAMPELRPRWLAILASAPILTTEEYLGLATLPEAPAWAIERARDDASNLGAAILLARRGALDPALTRTIEATLAPRVVALHSDVISAFGLEVPRVRAPFDGQLHDGRVVFASKALVLVRTADRDVTFRIPDTGAVRDEAVRVGWSAHGEPRVLERRGPDGAVLRFTVEL